MKTRLTLAMLLLATPAFAVLPSEQLADPALEARARAISTELRCVVCQNQTIDDSDAEVAHDLRVILRERLKAGDTDQQAIAYIVKRYGDYVLLKPPFKWETAILWLGPLAVLLGGALGVGFYLKRRGTGTAEPLTQDEQARLDRLLGKDLA
jgi:cytochrome c-type biogenesis protein CcmH